MDSELFRELDAIDNLGEYNFYEDNAPASPADIPRMANIYLRGVQDPFVYYTDEEFRNRYRFSKETVRNVIVPLFDVNNIPRQNNMRGLPIPNETKILVALRFYATGSFQRVCGDLQYISQPTVSRIIKNVSASLANMMDRYIKFPDNLIPTQNAFHQAQRRYPGLHHIVGAIDCTHIKIKRPRGLDNAEVYRNRKGYFSINTQAIVGRDMKIYDLVARWPGSSHDSRIFRNSRVCAQLEARRLQGVLVGDSGYRATTYMLTPYLNPTTPAQVRYNYVQVRTRNVVERFFGVWKKLFPCLQVGLNTKLTTTTNIIVACAVLHNIKIDCEGLELECDEQDGLIDVTMNNRIVQQNSASGLAYRNSIVEQFYNY